MISSPVFTPGVGVGAVRFGMSRDAVRALDLAPRYPHRWIESFRDRLPPTWFAAYDDTGRVIEVGKNPSFDPVAIPAGVHVGLSRAELHTIVRPAFARSAFDMFARGDVTLVVEYDEEWLVRAIASTRPADPVLDGVRLLKSRAEEVMSRIAAPRRPEPRARSEVESAVYPMLGLSLWRSAVPSDDPADPDLQFFASARLELPAN